MKSVSSLILLAVTLVAHVASASPKSLSSASALTCRKAVLKAAYEQFAADSKWTEDEINSSSYVDDATGIYQEPLDDGKIWTVDILSTDVREWDGSAQYKVSVEAGSTTCTVTHVELASSEGI